MKTLRVSLLAAALTLILGRIFTGIVYLRDGPPTYLVLKRAPSLESERTLERREQLREQYIPVMQEEIAIPGQPVYQMLMRWAFPLAAGFLIAGALLKRRR